MSNFTIQDYKEMCEMLTRERDYEHTRFLREQIKRSELQQEIESKFTLSTEELNNAVEDSITNQLEELNEYNNTDFTSIQELYDAWYKATEMIKEQDLHILMTEMKEDERKTKKTNKDDEDEDSDEDVVLSGDIVDFHRMKNDTKQTK